MGDIPPVDDIDAELRRARAAIKALKHAPMGETAAAARARSCQLIAAQQRLKAASRSVADPSAAKSVNGGSRGESDGALQMLLRVIAREFAKLEKRFEKRIVELEARSLTDGGTWKAGAVFKPGAVVPHDSTIWVCRQVNSDAKPGTSDAWRMMARTKGR